MSEFLTRMQMALAVGVGNPEFKYLRIKAPAQQEILTPYRSNRRYERALGAAQELARALQDGGAIEVSADAAASA